MNCNVITLLSVFYVFVVIFVACGGDIISCWGGRPVCQHARYD